MILPRRRVPKLGGWHLMGTACTGTYPDRSVVDPLGQGPRRTESLLSRWQRYGDLWRGQCDQYNPGHSPQYGRLHQSEPA